jgi:hypothetical protein
MTARGGFILIDMPFQVWIHFDPPELFPKGIRDDWRDHCVSLVKRHAVFLSVVRSV